MFTFTLANTVVNYSKTVAGIKVFIVDHTFAGSGNLIWKVNSFNKLCVLLIQGQ